MSTRTRSCQPVAARPWAPALLAGLLALLAPLAAALEVSPSLEPMPRVQPLVPTIEDPASLTAEDRLQRRLETLIRARDQSIRELTLQHQDLRPASDAPTTPALAEPVRERDQARLDLRRALESFDERLINRFQDVLDGSRPAVQAVQRSTLAATNQLRVAECYHDLAATGPTSASDLAAGRTALGLIDVAELGDGEPVRFRYLTAWFLIEQTRQARGEARQARLGEATAAVERLAQDFPTSELVSAARGLLAGLTLPGTAEQ